MNSLGDTATALTPVKTTEISSVGESLGLSFYHASLPACMMEEKFSSLRRVK